jgi:8-oxo-dGTP pyrophosphatase MutT (NUDIX family)
MKLLTLFKTLYENDEAHQQALDQTGFWGNAGAGVLFQARDTGRILFAHRSSNVEQPGTWGTWGGAMDGNENPVQAASREAYEETGVTSNTNDIVPMYVFSHSSGFRYYNFLVYTDTEFEPRLNWENQGYEWVEYGQWPTPLHFGAKDLLSDNKSIAILHR